MTTRRASLRGARAPDQSAEAAAALLSALLTPQTRAAKTDDASGSRSASPLAEFAFRNGAAFAVDDDAESLVSLTPVSPASAFSASPACRPVTVRQPPRPAALIKRKASPLEVLAAYAPPAAPPPPCPALEAPCLPGSRTLAPRVRAVSPTSPVPLEPTEFDLPVPRDGAVRKRHADFLMDVFPDPAPDPRFESPVRV